MHKKSQLKFITFSFLILLFSVVLIFSFTVGDGSLGNPYQITDCTDLQNMSYDLTANYTLVNDIDCSVTSSWNSGAGFNPIGIGLYFSGTLNGNNFNITNLFIDRSSTDYIGLISKTWGGNFSNIGLINVNISGRYRVGSLIGYNYYASIDNAYSSGQITATSNVGGLIGSHYDATLDNSYSNVDVYANSEVGGLIGDFISLGNGHINNSYATGNVEGTGSYVGGLVGWFSSNSGDFISTSYATGNVTGINDVGGLVGVADVGISDNGYINNSYATGNVKGVDNIGGLIGRNYGGSSESASIFNSYATGNVNGSDSVGGLIGENFGSSGNNGGPIYNSYATGNVIGINDVGGLVGLNDYIINYSFSSGLVYASNSNAGGLVGSNTGTITNSYWDNITSNQSFSDGGVGKTTSEMMQQITFVNWDFTNTWNISEGSSYPYLSWQTQFPSGGGDQSSPSSNNSNIASIFPAQGFISILISLILILFFLK